MYLWIFHLILTLTNSKAKQDPIARESSRGTRDYFEELRNSMNIPVWQKIIKAVPKCVQMTENCGDKYSLIWGNLLHLKKVYIQMELHNAQEFLKWFSIQDFAYSALRDCK